MHWASQNKNQFLQLTKIDLVDKESTHNPQSCEFKSHCRCEGLVGRQYVSISINTQRVWRLALTLVSPRGLTYLNFPFKKKNQSCKETELFYLFIFFKSYSFFFSLIWNFFQFFTFFLEHIPFLGVLYKFITFFI